MDGARTLPWFQRRHQCSWNQPTWPISQSGGVPMAGLGPRTRPPPRPRGAPPEGARAPASTGDKGATGRRVGVVAQWAEPRLAHRPPKAPFRITVIAHLRAEKDPMRAAAALARLPEAKMELVQIGEALDGELAAEAQAWVKREPRYRWFGGMTHRQALTWMAKSHVLVVSSVMEGGANVIAEAARIGTPVIASRVSGNLGMLGGDYPGYFPVTDDAALAQLLNRSASEPSFYRQLKSALRARRKLFAPAAERAALARVLREVLH